MLKFSSIEAGIYSLAEAHVCPIPFPSSLPSVGNSVDISLPDEDPPFETVLMLV